MLFHLFFSTRFIEIVMAESFSDVKEAAQSVAKEVICASVSRGDFKFIINADRATLIDALKVVSSTAITLGAFYTAGRIAEKITDAVSVALSGRRDGQEV